jgi:hypothetical protein
LLHFSPRAKLDLVESEPGANEVGNALDAEHDYLIANVRLPEDARSQAETMLVLRAFRPDDPYPYIAVLKVGYVTAEHEEAHAFYGEGAHRKVAEVAQLSGRKFLPAEMAEMVADLVLTASEDGSWFMVAAGSLENAFDPHHDFLRDMLGYPAERWPERGELLSAFSLGVLLFAVEIDLVKRMRMHERVKQADKRPWFRRRGPAR